MAGRLKRRKKEVGTYCREIEKFYEHAYRLPTYSRHKIDCRHKIDGLPKNIKRVGLSNLGGGRKFEAFRAPVSEKRAMRLP